MNEPLPWETPAKKTVAYSYDQAALLTAYGARDTRKYKGGEYESITWTEITKLAYKPASEDKSESQFIIPSDYIGADGRTHEVQTEKGTFWLLCVDIDTGNKTFREVDEATKAVVGDVLYLIYSSSGASSDNRKWRVLIPLQMPVAGSDYSMIQTILFERYAKQGIVCDGSLARTGQPVYLPNVPMDRRGEDGRPVFYMQQLNKSDALASTFALGLDDEAKERTARLEAAEAEAKAERIRKQAGRKTHTANGEVSPVEHFNQHYSIAQLFDQYGFKEGAQNQWLSPYSSGYSTKLYDDHWVSLSWSFVDQGVGNSKGVGDARIAWGDAFDLYVHFEHGGDYEEAVRTYGKEIRPNRSTYEPDYYVPASPFNREDLKAQQEAANVPETGSPAVSEPELHPLSKFVPISSKPKATTFLIKGVLTDKLSVFGAYPGKGKTTVWVPICLAIAGAMEIEGLEVPYARHVIYVSEHTEQVEALINALVSRGLCDIDKAKEFFHLVEAERMSPENLVKIAPYYSDMAIEYTRNDVTVSKKPYVVLDTASAVISIDDENDNASWGRAISKLKQQFYGIPTTIIAHTSKQHKHGNPEDMTIRGASAIEGDVNQVILLSEDPESESRYVEIAVPKHRFTASVYALKIHGLVIDVEVEDEHGDTFLEPFYSATVLPVSKEDKEQAKEQAAEAKKESQKEAALEVVLQIVDDLTANGEVATQSAIRSCYEAGEYSKSGSGYITNNSKYKTLMGYAVSTHQLIAENIAPDLAEKLKEQGKPVPKHNAIIYSRYGLKDAIENWESRAKKDPKSGKFDG